MLKREIENYSKKNEDLRYTLRSFNDDNNVSIASYSEGKKRDGLPIFLVVFFSAIAYLVGNLLIANII
jgi:hypothetical protein